MIATDQRSGRAFVRKRAPAHFHQSGWNLAAGEEARVTRPPLSRLGPVMPEQLRGFTPALRALW